MPANAFAQDVSFVVVRSDALAGPLTNTTQLGDAADAVVQAYVATGQPIPNVMSVWTTYPMGGNTLMTLFVPLANDVTGIGLETQYGSPGTFDQYPPLRAMLWHNDFTDLAARADRHHAPHEGYARYLFLLELSHLFGPALQVPGDTPGALIGFPFHWSFYLDACGSPAGGNVWHDNGDGTFDVVRQSPGEIRCSMLDLYMMGLAQREEVEPFGLLTNVTLPSGTSDPLNGGSVSAATFPWMGEETLTVTAERTTFTIDDVIAANGTRSPTADDAPKTFTLGIVLLVPADATDDAIASLGAQFDGIARALAPSFSDATRERGELTVVTSSRLPQLTPDAGVTPDAGPDVPPASSGCGCTIARPRQRGVLAMLLAAALWLWRRRRS